MRGFWRGIAIFILGGMFGTAFGIALGFFCFLSYSRRRLPPSS
jgi:hypothetical protein